MMRTIKKRTFPRMAIRASRFGFVVMLVMSLCFL